MDLLEKLKVIANITEGKTLSTYGGNISLLDHNSWYTTAWRTCSRENKKKTVLCIKGIIDEAMAYINREEIKRAIYDAFVGMEQLKKTYIDYPDTVIDIDKLILNYKTAIELNDLGEVYNVDDNDTTEKKNVCGVHSLETSEEIINEINNGNQELIEKMDAHDLGVDFLNDVRNNNYEMVENYLYGGNNANYLSSDGKNALHIVCDKQYYNLKMLKLLYSFHIDATLTDNDGYDPLYYAESTRCTEAILFLNQNIGKKKLATRA